MNARQHKCETCKWFVATPTQGMRTANGGLPGNCTIAQDRQPTVAEGSCASHSAYADVIRQIATYAVRQIVSNPAFAALKSSAAAGGVVSVPRGEQVLFREAGSEVVAPRDTQSIGNATDMDLCE